MSIGVSISISIDLVVSFRRHRYCFDFTAPRPPAFCNALHYPLCYPLLHFLLRGWITDPSHYTFRKDSTSNDCLCRHVDTTWCSRPVPPPWLSVLDWCWWISVSNGASSPLMAWCTLIMAIVSCPTTVEEEDAGIAWLLLTAPPQMLRWLSQQLQTTTQTFHILGFHPWLFIPPSHLSAQISVSL